MRRGLRDQLIPVAFFDLALVTAPFVPEAGVPLKVLPFGTVSYRYGVADVTTKWNAGRVVRGAHFTTIDRSGRCVKSVIQRPEVDHGWVFHKKGYAACALSS